MHTDATNSGRRAVAYVEMLPASMSSRGAAWWHEVRLVLGLHCLPNELSAIVALYCAHLQVASGSLDSAVRAILLGVCFQSVRVVYRFAYGTFIVRAAFAWCVRRRLPTLRACALTPPAAVAGGPGQQRRAGVDPP